VASCGAALHPAVRGHGRLKLQHGECAAGQPRAACIRGGGACAPGGSRCSPAAPWQRAPGSAAGGSGSRHLRSMGPGGPRGVRGLGAAGAAARARAGAAAPAGGSGLAGPGAAMWQAVGRTDDAVLVEVAPAPLGAKVLAEDDLHVLDVLPGPQRLKHQVREAQHLRRAWAGRLTALLAVRSGPVRSLASPAAASPPSSCIAPATARRCSSRRLHGSCTLHVRRQPCQNSLPPWPNASPLPPPCPPRPHPRSPPLCSRSAPCPGSDQCGRSAPRAGAQPGRGPAPRWRPCRAQTASPR
jgi:hypothetical protein